MNRIRHIILNVIILLLLCACEKEYDEINYIPNLVASDIILKDNCDYIVVIGDTQVYTNDLDCYSYFTATVDWIWSQCKHGKNIKCVLQTGDVTENNLPKQYQAYYNAMCYIANLIPVISCTGNHDYDWINYKITDRNSSLFSYYTTFPLLKSKVINYFEKDKMENIIVENYINSVRYDIISIEFAPRSEVLDWVKTYLNEHPERRYILMTHEYLDDNGYIVSDDESFSKNMMSTNNSVTPYQIWNDLLYQHNNIVMLLCGHNGFYAYRVSENSYGRNVPQILFDLQYQKNGGDGWIQLIEFPHNNDVANVCIYNVITQSLHLNTSKFQFVYNYN